MRNKLVGFQLTVYFEKQPEGGFTITCPDLPELITECDSLDEAEANVIDAFRAVVGLYEHKQIISFKNSCAFPKLEVLLMRF